MSLLPYVLWGCQEKTSASTGERVSCLDLQPCSSHELGFHFHFCSAVTLVTVTSMRGLPTRGIPEFDNISGVVLHPNRCNKSVFLAFFLSSERLEILRDWDPGLFRALWLRGSTPLGVRRADGHSDTGCANPAGSGRHSGHQPHELAFPHRIGLDWGTYRRSDLVSRRVRAWLAGAWPTVPGVLGAGFVPPSRQESSRETRVAFAARNWGNGRRTSGTEPSGRAGSDSHRRNAELG